MDQILGMLRESYIHTGAGEHSLCIVLASGDDSPESLQMYFGVTLELSAFIPPCRVIEEGLRL